MKPLKIDDDTYFVSDTHFGHDSAIGFGKRKNVDGRLFADANEMNAAMVAAWNDAVPPDALVVHLGDFAMRMSKIAQLKLFNKLHGRKILVRGNHDQRADRLPWIDIHDIAILEHAGQRIVCCHYPMREWPGYHTGAIHLFGHTHAKLLSSNRSLDVGVDEIGYAPLSILDIKQRMAALPDIDFRAVKPEVDDAEDDHLIDYR
ncbi:metallophosphoesterase family protein [Pelagibacterium mangrovi]|uniref:metallophosphoesterase family protein n=1 Tax=Pelagibacterium mangrovi TaxID=3119828 RepID=UPI002FCA06F5